MAAGAAGGWRRPSTRNCSSAAQQSLLLELDYYSYICVKGVDAKKYLQGLCTNDVNQLNSSAKNCIAAAFLTPQGRIFADAILYSRKSSIGSSSSSSSSNSAEGDDIIIETDKNLSKKLLQYLIMYKLRSKVEISELSNAKTVFVTSCSSKNDDSNGINDARISMYDIIARSRDPRAEKFGARFLVDCSNSGKQGADSQKDTYISYRMRHGMAEGLELVDRIPLECNLDLLHYISFSKGCYVGQELTARTKYKGLVRKRLLPFIPALPSRDSGRKTEEGHFEPLQAAFNDLLDETTSLHSAITVGDKIVAKKEFLRASLSGPFASKGADVDSIDCGKVVAVDKNASVGIALVSLQYVLSGAYTSDGLFSAQSSGGDGAVVRVFRPLWFPDIDVVTGKKLDDFNS